MKTLSQFPPLVRGYLSAALFTTDPDGPGGVDYVECGRADEMLPRIPQPFIDQAAADCDHFQALAGPLIEGQEERAGADLWYTRNGHGVGFWEADRWPDDVGDKLDEITKAHFRETDLELGGWWLNSYRCQCGESWTRPEDADNDPNFGEDTCDACHATVESDNRRTGGRMEAISAPEE